jgi:hypothetical protein
LASPVFHGIRPVSSWNRRPPPSLAVAGGRLFISAYRVLDGRTMGLEHGPDSARAEQSADHGVPAVSVRQSPYHGFLPAWEPLDAFRGIATLILLVFTLIQKTGTENLAKLEAACSLVREDERFRIVWLRRCIRDPGGDAGVRETHYSCFLGDTQTPIEWPIKTGA